jgi:hypothetical protein
MALKQTQYSAAESDEINRIATGVCTSKKPKQKSSDCLAMMGLAVMGLAVVRAVKLFSI